MSAVQPIFGTETVTSLAARIKAKYPDYAEVEDSELVHRVLVKHPDYINALSADARKDLFSRPTQFEKERTPEGFISHAAQFVKAQIPSSGREVLESMAGAVSPQYAGKRAAEATVGEFQRARGAGHGIPYSTAAAANIPLGVSAERMERAAASGDPGGVLGEVAIPATAAAMGIKEVRQVAGKAAAPIRAGAAATTELVRASIPSRLMNSILRTPKKGYRFGKNPGLAVAQEGIVANSEAGLMDAIKAKAGEIELLRNAELAKAKTVHPIDIHKTIREAIEPEIKHARTIGNRNGATALEQLRDDLIAEHPRTMTPVEATKLKSELGKSTNWTTDSTQAAMNDARRRIYSRLRFQVELRVPKVAKLNERWGNLLEAEKSLEGAIAVGERKNFLGMGDIVAGTAGALIGGTAGGPGGAGLASTALVAGRRVMGSVPVKTRVAKTLARKP